jgi:hypothetical protein
MSRRGGIKSLTDFAAAIAAALLERAGLDLPRNWAITVAYVIRGRACHRRRLIVIPAWCFNVDAGHGKPAYYIAHELAHAMLSRDHGHDPAFYGYFKRLCPPQYWHFESNYKPREFKAALARENAYA